MATAMTDLESRTTSEMNERGESFGEVALTFAAMGGAVSGAVGGAILGAEAGSFFPVLLGTLGTMLGSGLAVGGYLLVRGGNARRTS